MTKASPPELDARHLQDTRLQRVESRFEAAVPVERAFSFFSDPRTLDTVTPPSFRLRISSPLPARLSVGDTIDYRMRWRLLPFRWQSVITEIQPPQLLSYEQARGPYRIFRHQHRFEPRRGSTVVIDRIDFLPRFYRIIGSLVRLELERILEYRAAISSELLAPAYSTAARDRLDSRIPRISASSSTIDEPR